MLDRDVMLCEQIWDAMFSSAALDVGVDEVCNSVGGSGNSRRAVGIPGIMNAISIGRASLLLTGEMRELGMAPSILIGHLLSIGWAGRMEFAGRIRVAYAQWRAASGG